MRTSKETLVDIIKRTIIYYSVSIFENGLLTVFEVAFVVLFGYFWINEESI